MNDPKARSKRPLPWRTTPRRTTQLYDRRRDEVSLDEVERANGLHPARLEFQQGNHHPFRALRRREVEMKW